MTSDAQLLYASSPAYVGVDEKGRRPYNSEKVGLEEIAIALVELGAGVHCEIWQALGFDVTQFEGKVRAVAEARRGEEAPPSRIPYTEGVKQMLANAAREAKQMNSSYVGTEHVLLGLLQVDSPVDRVLQEMGLTREGVMEEALKRKGRPDW